MNNRNVLKIKKLRQAAGLTQHELAKLLQVSQPLIVAYENGARSPKPVKLIELAQALNVSVQDLFCENHTPSVN